MRADLHVEWGEGEPPPSFNAAAPIGAPAEPPGRGMSWAIGFADGAPLARLATTIRSDLTGAPGPTGIIGHYAAREAPGGSALLMAAVARLRGQGVARILGPMNGSTWGRYRFALPAKPGAPEEPPFLGEPVNPPGYPAHFTAAGFHAVAAYESRISYDLGTANPKAAAGEAAVATRDITIGSLDLARFDEALRELHALSTRAFEGNLYYSPIDAADFDALYRPMRELIDPGLVLLARAPGGELVAYVFAYVDPLGLRAGKPYRLIVKTLATHPDWRGLGLGGVLVERLHAAARARGLGAIVHALMHADNDSVKISAHTAQVFRRYALYEHAGSHGG